MFQPSSSPVFTPTQLYLMPSLSINTGVGMNGQVQMSPHPMVSAGFMQKQQHQQHQQQQGMQGQMGQFRYGMLGMGLPSGMLGGFGYMPVGDIQPGACVFRSCRALMFSRICSHCCLPMWRFVRIGLCTANSASFPKCEYSADAWGILACCPMPQSDTPVRGQSTCHSICRRTIESCPFWTTRVYPRSPREVVYFCLSLMPAPLLPSMLMQ